MKIGEMTARTGVATRLLRYYEQQGLLSPQRTATGYRVFTESDVHRVLKIRSLLRAGVGTYIIRQILGCVDENQVDFVPLCPAVVEELRSHRQRIDRGVAELTAQATHIEALISEALSRQGEHSPAAGA